MSHKRPGHYGVYIGKAEKTDGRKVYIRAEEPVFKGDVLEIRNNIDEKAVYEFTLGESYEKGAMFSVLTMKDRKAAKGSMVYRTKKDILLRELYKKYIEKDVKVGVDIYLEAKIGEPLYMRMKLEADRADIDGNYLDRNGLEEAQLNGEDSIRADLIRDNSKRNDLLNDDSKREKVGEYFGQTVQKAQTSASSQKELAEQVSKLGNTIFYALKTKIVADEGVFIPVGELKKCRRECAEQLYGKLVDIWKRKAPDLGGRLPFTGGILKNLGRGESMGEDIIISASEKNLEPSDASYDKAFIISVRSLEQLRLVSEADVSNAVTDIYMDISVFWDGGMEPDEILDIVEAGGRKLTVKLPLILRKRDFASTKELCNRIKDRAAFLVSNYESLELVREIGGRYRTDHNIYCWNEYTKNILKSGYTLPEELNETELKEIAGKNGEMIVYGLLPVMVSAQCVYKTLTGKCGKHEDISLKDEKEFTFRTHSECRYCYNCIYNSAVKSLFERPDSILNLECKRIRAELTFEDVSEIRLVVKALEIFKKKLEESERGTATNDWKNGRYIGESPDVRIFPAEVMNLKLTNGHLYRGVE